LKALPLSVRYRTLGPRITQLSRHLLPRPTTLGLYTDRQYDRIRAYVVLAHAEVEFCMERIAWEAVSAANISYVKDGTLCKCLAALLKIAWVPKENLPKKWNDWTESRRIKWVTKFYEQVLASNHGASKGHVLRIASPLGIIESDLDPNWLTDANTLFAKRGLFAHTGAGAQSDPNPIDERNTIVSVTRGLRHLDRLMTARAK
jgi:hypothetical protein